MARLLRPVTRMISSSPDATASSTTYWMVGLSTIGSISFGCALVAGRNRVPSPAAGKTALRTFCSIISQCGGTFPRGASPAGAKWLGTVSGTPVDAEICNSGAPVLSMVELGQHRMAYVIAEPCIGTKDTACVDACPVDCIHPKKDEANHADAEMLYIDPVECIDCGACVPVCPVSAIFALDDLPEKWASFTQKNAEYY